MKELILQILNEYLHIFPEEKLKLEDFTSYITAHSDKQITDWNNFDGHIVASGFVYAKEENKFLVLFHNDSKRYLYPGGHIDNDDMSPLSAAIREVIEETGLNNITEIKITKNELVPIDIDTHMVKYNKRLNLPKHFHFDFRYLFFIDSIQDIMIDKDESSTYKWIGINELIKENFHGNVVEKIIKLLNLNKY